MKMFSWSNSEEWCMTSKEIQIIIIIIINVIILQFVWVFVDVLSIFSLSLSHPLIAIALVAKSIYVLYI